MSYPINNNINPTAYPQAMTSGNSIALPMDSEKLKQTIASNSVIKPPSKEDHPALLPALTLGTLPFVYYGVNKFNTHCQGEYNTTILHKLGNFGDKIASYIPEAIREKLGNGCSTAIKKLDEKIIRKSSILDAVFHKPSVPSNKLVLPISKGTIGELASHAAQILEKFAKAEIPSSKELIALGCVKKNGKADVKAYIQRFTLEGRDIEKLKSFGFEGAEGLETYKKLVEHSYDNVDEIHKICNKLASSEATKAFSHPSWKIPWTNKYISEMVPKRVKEVMFPANNFSELANKMSALAGKTAETVNIAKTGLGKFLPKITLRGMEGLVNGNTGGAIGLLFGAYIIAESIKKSIKAPSDEKGKTFAENMIYNLGWYLTMPFGLKLMHSAGGSQYIGMSKARVSRYRKGVESLNLQAKAGEITKEVYRAEKNKLKELLKGSTKRFIKNGKLDPRAQKVIGSKVSIFLKGIVHKPLKWVGRVLTVGLETIRPYNFKNGNILDKAAHIPYKLKGFAGWPMRFGVFMFLIAPFLAKFGAKASHLMFGKPTHSVLDEGKEEAEKAKAQATPAEIQQMANQIQAQQIGQPGGQPEAQGQQTPSVLAPAAQVNKQAIASEPAKESSIDVSSQKPATQSATGQPQVPVRKYIPSTEGFKMDPNHVAEIQAKDDKVNLALSRSEAAEKNANRYAH